VTPLLKPWQFMLLTLAGWKWTHPRKGAGRPPTAREVEQLVRQASRVDFGLQLAGER